MSVKNINDASYTPVVLASQVEWEKLEVAIVLGHSGINDPPLLLISAMSYSELCFLKQLLDAYVLKRVMNAVT